MTTTLGDISAKPVRNASREVLICSGTFTFGAAGVIASSDVDDPKLAAATFAAGLGAITFPQCARMRLLAFIRLSAAATVTEVIATAESATAGTATLRTSKAGAAVNPASGDKLEVLIYGYPSGG